MPVEVHTKNNAKDDDYFEFVIVGGGIAGVVCAETLCELIRPSRFGGGSGTSDCQDARVALVSATSTVKTTINLQRITNMIESFDVAETPGSNWSKTWSGTLTLVQDTVDRLSPSDHLIFLKLRGPDCPIRYGRLCLTTGGVPRLITHNNPLVIGLRDTESLVDFQSRLRNTRRLMLVGNGGIATEIAHEVKDCQIVWAIKDTSVSAPFLDPSAAKFLLHAREVIQSDHKQSGEDDDPTPRGDSDGPMQIRRMRYVVCDDDQLEEEKAICGTSQKRLTMVLAQDGQSTGNNNSLPDVLGSALGPDWACGKDLRGCLDRHFRRRLLKIVYQVRVKRVLSPSEFELLGTTTTTNPFPGDTEDNLDSGPWPVYVELTNGEVYGCDLVISAVGVEASFQPNRSCVSEANAGELFGTLFHVAPATAGGGVLVDDQMLTSVEDVYAAGDCAYANWTWAPHWFQMRLWSQARQMGFQAAKSMFGHSQGVPEIPLDFSFELFTHVTYFFGFKVVLLGLYNGQGLDLTSSDCYLLLRVTSGKEFVKCVMKSGRMQGALLIGETDLEETLENLILNQLDLTPFENSLLNPDIDLSDYFD
ncbi:hypothetical protein EG68_03509 [Paragonimus skrjabini miyazakii]|uniref:FAD/NAD(P)-binding domain-containing protein n=1 Tax=Paragonimus skrjabini miyazakii TaxID=59628 RepID=A0A8S9YUL8_9TREM|nr:hypothetical protein EG68_03509 [Paragonimus skrjabini miyazakii]